MGRKVSNRTSFAVLVLFAASNLVQAAPIIISEDNKGQINLHQQLMIFEDLSGQQSIETVMNQQFHRVPLSDEKSLSFGYSQSVYWLKFELHNQTANHNCSSKTNPHDVGAVLRHVVVSCCSSRSEAFAVGGKRFDRWFWIRISMSWPWLAPPSL